MKINLEHFNGIVNDRTIVVDNCVLDQFIVSDLDRGMVIGRPTLYLAANKIPK